MDARWFFVLLAVLAVALIGEAIRLYFWSRRDE
jgi:cell division protein FtsX